MTLIEAGSAPLPADNEVENHDFTVSPNIIAHLIKSQAGSIGKGVLEAVANAVDSGSTRVDIDVSATTLVITDSGCGLQSRDEILKVFKVFGFVHDDKSRDHGQFGMGRAQLWAWASTFWRTRTFSLDVDVRRRGINFELEKNLDDQPGLRIEATFYTPLTFVELTELQRELDVLCKFATITINVNGKCINKAPAKESWHHETDTFWLRTTDTGSLKVYSQGFFVREYSASLMGIGGVLVSKLKSPFKVNFARNDVLQQECPLWKEARALCSTLSADKTKKKSGARLADTDRDFLAAQTADPAFFANFDRGLFSLSNGRHLTLKQLANFKSFLSVSEKGNRMAETIMRDGKGIVLLDQTLARFGASTVGEFRDALLDRLNGLPAHAFHYERSVIERMKVFEDLSKAPAFKQLESSCIAHAALTPLQKAIVTSLSDINFIVSAAVRKNHPFRSDLHNASRREIRLGRSTHAEAWTDGSTFIAFSDAHAENAAKQGLPGFTRLVAVLLHEHLHDGDDAGSHAHDPDFYEAYHEISIEGADQLSEAVTTAFRTFCRLQERLTKTMARQMDAIAGNGAGKLK